MPDLVAFDGGRIPRTARVEDVFRLVACEPTERASCWVADSVKHNNITDPHEAFTLRRAA